MPFSTKIAPRYSESTIFRGSRGPKMSQEWRPKLLPAATRLQERLGRLLGSICARFSPPFWRLKWPWSPLENDSKNENNLKRFEDDFRTLFFVRATWVGGVGAARKSLSWRI